MDPQVVNYIQQFGYLSIFLGIFLQELNLPYPVPVELLAFFAGYMAYENILSLPLVLLVAIAADFLGTVSLYLIFYFFGRMLVKHPPRWFPIKPERIEHLTKRFSSRGALGIYFGRLIPYMRVMISSGSGLLQIKPKRYLPIVLCSSFTWIVVLAVLGYTLGPRLGLAAIDFSARYFFIFLIVSFIVSLIFIGYATFKREEKV